MGININIINFGGHSHISILYRAELSQNWGGVKKGTQGWLEWNGKDLTLELDKPIYKGGVCYQYRVCGYGRKYYKNPQYILVPKKETNKNLMKRLKFIKATDEERIDYFIKKLKTYRKMLSMKTDKNANYKLIKGILMFYVEQKKYDEVNKILKALVNDLKREDDIFTPIIIEEGLTLKPIMTFKMKYDI